MARPIHVKSGILQEFEDITPLEWGGGPAIASSADVALEANVYTTSEIDTQMAGKSDVGHLHSAADITSGNFSYDRLPTGSGSWDPGIGNTPTLARGLAVTGGGYGEGRFFYDPTYGVALIGKPGSSYDMSFHRPGTLGYIMRVPTGTANVEFFGTLTSTVTTANADVHHALYASGAGGAEAVRLDWRTTTGHWYIQTAKGIGNDLRVYDQTLGAEVMRWKAGTKAVEMYGSLSVTGAVSVDGGVHRSVASSALQLAGGNSLTSGANYLLYGGAHSSAGLHQWRNGSTEIMRLTGSGILALGTTVTTSASAGDIVLKFGGSIRGVNSGNNDTQIIARTNTNNTVAVIQLTGGLPVYIPNASAPGANPSGGGFLYVETGALKYRGSSGTVTVLGAA